MERLTRGKVSVSDAWTEVFKYAPRKKWTFSYVPVPIKVAAADRARELDMTLIEFFYHCLRLGGVDIPEKEKIDGRRR